MFEGYNKWKYYKLREEVNNKINEIKDKIYIPKASIIGPGMPFGFNTLSFIALHILHAYKIFLYHQI